MSVTNKTAKYAKQQQQKRTDPDEKTAWYRVMHADLDLHVQKGQRRLHTHVQEKRRYNVSIRVPVTEHKHTTELDWMKM